jgi:hypothetical protein
MMRFVTAFLLASELKTASKRAVRQGGFTGYRDLEVRCPAGYLVPKLIKQLVLGGQKGLAADILDIVQVLRFLPNIFNGSKL